ncbi:TRAP transporter small permease [Paracoccus sp. MKU1]|uniref:TRAP transporter small permease n=1 Tax=Paracoccus sp. MKU1 TaxID=1745182 RepID=UPI0007193F74|nr:TRAP transporter small permease [Paracoccus sp. MKU1]KRW97040.1 hypothetical protein AQY21_05870 [Paracoccus sp. MKU1]
MSSKVIWVFFPKLIRIFLLSLGSIGILALILLVFADIIARNLFSVPIPGVLEISQYWLMVTLVAIGLWWASVDQSHVEVTLLTEHLGTTSRRVAAIIVAVVSIPFLVWLAWLGFDEAMKALARSEYAGAYRIPIWWVRFVIAAGFLALGIMIFLRTVRIVQYNDEVPSQHMEQPGVQ